MSRYRILYSDPCWDYSNNLNGRPELGGKPYDTLTMAELSALPIPDIAEKDSLLFQWATFPKLKESIELMENWGYKFITVPFVWLKINPSGKVIETVVEGKALPNIEIIGGIYSGLGHYTNGNSEIVLMGKRGKGVPRISKSVKQTILAPDQFETDIVVAPRAKHSAKPAEVRNRIDALFGSVSKVELFSRQNERLDSYGWTNVGNEVSGYLDIREALELIKSDSYYN